MKLLSCQCSTLKAVAYSVLFALSIILLISFAFILVGA